MVLRRRGSKLVPFVFIAALVAVVVPARAAVVLNVEVDWLKADDHDHKPNACELAAVQAAFARHGITLNIEMSDEIEEDATNQVINFSADNDTRFDEPDGEWFDIESTYRDHAAGTGWHYMLFAHDYGIESDAPSGSSGLAEINGDEFVVTLGTGTGMVGTPWDRAGTFMHEFGHNLGLRHAGNQNETVVRQYKPNYPSVMAYRYQLIGVRRGIQCQKLGYPPLPFYHLDYSNGTLCPLDEEALYEPAGIGYGGVDWNCGGEIVGTVAQDVSSQYNWCTANGPETIITDYDDWSNLNTAAAFSVSGPNRETVTCMPPSALERAIGCIQPDPCAPDNPDQCTSDAECDDGNPCTDDSCGSVNGVFVCQNVNDDTNPCNDFNPCTRDDACHDGVCEGEQRCHFQCYEMRRRTFSGPLVKIEDQFGSANGVFLNPPERLCAPADKNGEDPQAPADPEHLVGYPIRGSFNKQLQQRIVNQFGETFVDVVKRDRLFVPTTKSLQAPFPAPPNPPTIDHFQCYKVRRSRGTPKFVPVTNVSVVDQFGAHVLELRKPIRLCAPVDKNDESFEAPHHTDHLLCYRSKAVRFPDEHVFLNNQFGPTERDLIRRVEFCVPSLKNPPEDPICEPGTTTTLVTTTTSTTSTTL